MYNDTSYVYFNFDLADGKKKTYAHLTLLDEKWNGKNDVDKRNSLFFSEKKWNMI